MPREAIVWYETDEIEWAFNSVARRVCWRNPAGTGYDEYGVSRPSILDACIREQIGRYAKGSWSEDYENVIRRLKDRGKSVIVYAGGNNAAIPGFNNSDSVNIWLKGKPDELWFDGLGTTAHTDIVREMVVNFCRHVSYITQRGKFIPVGVGGGISKDNLEDLRPSKYPTRVIATEQEWDMYTEAATAAQILDRNAEPVLFLDRNRTNMSILNHWAETWSAGIRPTVALYGGVDNLHELFAYANEKLAEGE